MGPGKHNFRIKALVQINKNVQHKIVDIFLPINFNISFGCSEEPFKLRAFF